MAERTQQSAPVNDYEQGYDDGRADERLRIVEALTAEAEEGGFLLLGDAIDAIEREASHE